MRMSGLHDASGGIDDHGVIFAFLVVEFWSSVVLPVWFLDQNLKAKAFALSFKYFYFIFHFIYFGSCDSCDVNPPELACGTHSSLITT